ncbi:ubiquinone biosynthesis O-methyltransferase-like [Anopheles cruzii]|uniref:ubiquinone biosynthesis O-methyltransferase-like n=1 Tax=Anopheles cruzii TaxID=68878 RepID=UPI0022EC4DB9|nr:ubiquinone biosynthesis O-methyltransferase-like [Anopheles cruzii]
MDSKLAVICELCWSFLQAMAIKCFRALSVAFLSLVDGLSMRGTVADEVATFDQLASRWWNLDGPMMLLHKLNDLRVPLVVEGLISAGKMDRKQRFKTDALEGLKILDVGCAGGIYTEALAKLHATVVGIDPAEHLIEVAKAHAETQPELKDRCHFLVESMEQHAAGDNSAKYDVVVLSETIEHVVDKSELLKDIASVLKSGGSVFITTWSKQWWGWLLAVVILERVMRLLPRGTHDYSKFISQEDAEAMLEGYNCRTVERRAYYLKFWENEWTWVPFNNFAYTLHAIKE